MPPNTPRARSSRNENMPTREQPQALDLEPLAEGIKGIARALDALGFNEEIRNDPRRSAGGGPYDGKGALEAHSMIMGESVAHLASAVEQVASAIEDGFERLASAIESTRTNAKE